MPRLRTHVALRFVSNFSRNGEPNAVKIFSPAKRHPVQMQVIRLAALIYLIHRAMWINDALTIYCRLFRKPDDPGECNST
jgi:hypothetical protein